MQKLSEILRKRRDYTPIIQLKEIAAESGLAQSTLSLIEAQKRTNSRYTTVVSIVAAMRKLKRGRKHFSRKEDPA